MGRREPVDGYLAVVNINLHAAPTEDNGTNEPGELLATITCPESLARPIPPGTATRPGAEALTRDVAWILTVVEALPARERAAVTGFIHGLKQGANLYSETTEATPSVLPRPSGQ